MNQRGVGGQPRQHFASACHLEKRRPHAQHMLENRRTNICDHPLTQPANQINPRRNGYSHHTGQREQGEKITINGTRLVGEDARINDMAHRDRHRQCCPSGNQQRHKGQAHGSRIGFQERNQTAQRA